MSDESVNFYSSRDGQTREIAARIARTLTPQQLCDVLDLAQAPQVEWAQYDRVLIGASIRYGHFQPELMKFVTHKAELQQRVSGFFSVNLTARKADKCTPETNAYTRKFRRSHRGNRIAVRCLPVRCAIHAIAGSIAS